MASWTDGYWWSNDGLRLHYRDYAGGADGRPPIICIPGLTRNARDFENVAARLAGDWRLICVDLRGRGDSAFAKDAMSYVPLTYLHDLEALLKELALDRFVLFGTSLGGIISALISSTGRGRVVGTLLNDVGPVLDPMGLGRIRTYVGRGSTFPTWVHAARCMRETLGHAYPDYTVEQWLRLAKRLCRLAPSGKIVHDYDMKIAEPFRAPGGEAGIDMWAPFESLGDAPVTLLHGELSDLLTPAGVEGMAARIPGLHVVTVPRVGHAPTLDEPESISAIDLLLERVRDGAGRRL